MTTIVYKLGGSLLDLPELGAKLRQLLWIRPPFMSADASEFGRLLVVGGGPTADLVRRWDQMHRVGDEASHALALHAMTLNARLLATILPDSQLVETRARAESVLSADLIAVIAAAEFVEIEERMSRERLPRTWDVTSDSIAAYVAAHWPADALVLIKSTNCSPGIDWRAAARDRLVDPYFPEIATHIPNIGWVNLRGDEAASPAWMTRSSQQSAGSEIES